MSIKKQPKLLCIDFEFQEYIYNPLMHRHKWLDITIINRADMALKLLEDTRFDAILTTIVVPGELDGLKLIDRIHKYPKKYGSPEIAVITGLGGDIILEQIEKRKAVYIDRYTTDLNSINSAIDNFLSRLPEFVPYTPEPEPLEEKKSEIDKTSPAEPYPKTPPPPKIKFTKLSDTQMLNFIRYAGKHPSNGYSDGIDVVVQANKRLDEGMSIKKLLTKWTASKEFYYAGRKYGFSLKAEKLSKNKYRVYFGYSVAPLAGNGGTWVVKFNEKEEVVELHDEGRWIS